MNAHETAVKQALRAGDDIDRLIARLGTAQHPRGAVLTAYRNAERGMRDVLGGSGPRKAAEAAEVMGGLQRELSTTAADVLNEAVRVGQRNAAAQAQAQGLGGGLLGSLGAAFDIAAMIAAWMAVVDQQRAAVTALVATGADEDEILGDGQRAGVLRPGPVVAEGSRWVASAVTGAMIAAFLEIIRRSGGGGAAGPGRPGAGQTEWYHQAVAAIDERTTDCCLQVHGQVQPLDKPFQLTGTPRYADELDHPPFHWYCRSAEAMLHRSQVGDDLTREMEEAARAERVARDWTGTREEIHPAHSRSRR